MERHRVLLSESQNFLYEGKMSFLRRTLLDFGLNIGEWDADIYYDVDAKLLIKKILLDNNVSIEDNVDDTSFKVMYNSCVRTWKATVAEYVIDNNKMYIVFNVCQDKKI